jgi:uncharacterized protein YifE (UPF0438 family)
MTQFTKQEISLLHYHLRFYQSLQAGFTAVDTTERQHFVAVIKGEAIPTTEHEKVFLKYLSSNQTKVDGMIYRWSLNKSNPNNPSFDDEIF